MNKLKNLKTKAGNTSPESPGLFSKLTKRYTNAVSAKLRRSQSPPTTIPFRSKSPQKHIISGSYDMNGHHSDDHRIEIGAPILISKTNFDLDRFDESNATQNPRTSTQSQLTPPTTATTIISSTGTSTSNESENDIFSDAISSFPPNVQDIKFEFLSAEDKENSPDGELPCLTNDIKNTTNFRYNDEQQGPPPPPPSSKLKHNESNTKSKSNKIKHNMRDCPLNTNYSTPTIITTVPLNDTTTKNNNKNRSKSVQNLHKSEIRLILEKTPSNFDFTTADLENCFDLPVRRDSLETIQTTTTSNSLGTSNQNDLDEFVSPSSSPIQCCNSISPITSASNNSPIKYNSSIQSSNSTSTSNNSRSTGSSGNNDADNDDDDYDDDLNNIGNTNSPTISSKSIVMLRQPYIAQLSTSTLIKNSTMNKIVDNDEYFNNTTTAADSYYKSPTELKPISNINISPHYKVKSKSPQPPPPLPPVDIDMIDGKIQINNDENIQDIDDDNNDESIDTVPLTINSSFDLINNSDLLQQNILNKKLSHSEPNTPNYPEKTDFKIYHFKSAESLQNHHRHHNHHKLNQHNYHYNNSNSNSNINLTKNQNINDINLYNNYNESSLDDFDLKSVSLQSLNAKNLFLSIEELNEITKEINNSEEFNNEIDLEYCEHRDNLKPNERRITLLKNKNSRLINLHRNKEKLNNAWSGLKQWIGEEKGKFKDVVQKHAAMQRVGATTNNMNGNNTSGTLAADSRHTNDSFKQNSCNSSRSVSIDRNYHPSHQPSGISSYTSSMMSINRTESTAPTLIGDDINDAIGDDSESVFTLSGGGRGGVGVDSGGDGSIGISNAESKSTINLSAGTKRIFKNKETWEGQNGFEELRRYVKQGGDFGKDLVNILQERIDAELIYSKSLSKMANKLNKACRDVPGTIVDAWRGVATEMESRSEVHRQLSTSLNDEICKPLKSLLEAHHKTRKTIETNVDKASRILSEWRISESKSKKISHTAARENEKLQDAMLDVRIQKSPSIALLHQQNLKEKNVSEKEIKSAEKDCAKLDNKRRKAEEAVKRADVEYYTLCIRAERARVDWEMSVLRGSTVLQNLEMQRLSTMKQFMTNYTRLTSDINPILEQLCQRLLPQLEACNIQKDLQVVKNIRRAAEGPSEQLLPDFYCEHTTLAMNRERRKHALIKLLQLVKTDLERERRSRNGLKGLSQTMINQDNQNVTDKLYHIRSMLTYLEGSRFKLQSALLELDHKPRSAHPLASHIQITRDRTGLQQSILKVPLWLKNDDKISSNEEEINNQLNDSSNRDSESSNGSGGGGGEGVVIGNGIIINNNNCIDIKNEMLINKNFNRSKSTTDILSNGIVTHLTELNTQHTTQKNNTISGGGGNDNNIHHHNNLLDSPNFDRGIADGGSNQPDSDFDEFSSQDDDDDNDMDGNDDIDNRQQKQQRHSIDKLNGINNHIDNSFNISNNSNNSINNSKIITTTTGNGITTQATQQTQQTTKTIVLSRCKALYSYTPKLYDELELTPGDIIEVHVKQDDGWWLGALGDQIGIFPATYVEEFV